MEEVSSCYKKLRRTATCPTQYKCISGLVSVKHDDGFLVTAALRFLCEKNFFYFLFKTAAKKINTLER